jgi:hypothetical protein
MSSGQDHLLGFILSRQQANLHAPYSIIFQTAGAMKQVIPVYHMWNTQHNSSQIMYAAHPPSLHQKKHCPSQVLRLMQQKIFSCYMLRAFMI